MYVGYDTSGSKPLNNNVSEEISQPFRPRARLLQLLGDELIGSARLAVFEMVKNAYDADANTVTVSLQLAPQKAINFTDKELDVMDVDKKDEPRITVIDDGEGMTLDVLRSVWLVPGDDHRQRERLANHRTPRHGRLPLGEKGLGRFAAHKLGNRITLTTRSEGTKEYVVDIDWNELIGRSYLDEAPVTIRQREPEEFLGKKTGTRIEIRELRENWSRGNVRRLHNQITSLCSPFEEPAGFKAILQIPGLEDWTADLPDVSEILTRAFWKFSFRLDTARFDWTYEFRKVAALNLEDRTVTKLGERLKLPAKSGDDRMERKVVADEETFEGIGPISGVFYVYDRDKEVRRKVPNIQAITSFLDQAGGVRVYRDGIRVYNYGESGDDWLGLDLRRVNIPTRRISNNIILGAIHLSLKESTGLIEKTNREGFVENIACRELRRIVLGALAALESERQLDKERIRQLTVNPDDPITAKIDKPIQDLRRALEEQGVQEEFEEYVVRIEQNYKQMQETYLAAGMSGLNLAVVFHEVEHGVKALHRIISEETSMENAARQARDLVRLLEGFTVLLRRDSTKLHTSRQLARAAERFNKLRFRHHHIQFTCPLLQNGGDAFRSRFNFSLVAGALNNLVDNALYWLRVKWPDLQESGELPARKLYMGLSRDFESGPAIVVADNGPGFEDDPEYLVRPFFTRKPNGMGLGLYYANLAMELNGGQLVFPRRGEVEVPDEFEGAVVALVFKEAQ